VGGDPLWCLRHIVLSDLLSLTRRPRALLAIAILAALSTAGNAAAAPQRARPPVTPVGTLTQLSGSGGCLRDRSEPGEGCTAVRALRGPAPFLGSEAVAVSPDGRNVYVAASRSNAIAVFTRSASTGRLTQASGAAGCVAAGRANGCAGALGLNGPNSVAVSPDGRNVYATTFGSDTIDAFHRNLSTGALTQLGGGAGCVANAARPGCTTARGLGGPDVVTVSPDGLNVYVGSFTGDTIAAFARNPSTGALTQLPEPAGCIVNAPTAGCTTGASLAAPEGMAVSPDGTSIYVAAALSNALDVFSRNPSTGALTQLTAGSGCIVDSPLSGCTTGVQLAGADAVNISPDDENVYVTSLLSNSVTAFTRSASTGQLAQLTGTSACVVELLAVGCSLGRELEAPEGLAVSPEGASVYATAFASGAVDVFNRNSKSGALVQKPRSPGCETGSPAAECVPARALLGVSSAAISPDGRDLYSAAFKSDAVAVFRRATAPAHQAGRSERKING
jgi:DNA-binding beta-propeller fold protein YncE